MKYFELQMEGFCATLIISGHGGMKEKIYTGSHIDYPLTVYCRMFH